MDDLITPQTWELLPDGTYRGWVVDGRVLSGRFGTRISEWHAGWDGDAIVLRLPDGSDRVCISLDDWCRPGFSESDAVAELERLIERTDQGLAGACEELLASHPDALNRATARLEGHRAAAAAAEQAAAAEAEASRRAAAERRERMRPVYGFDGDDLVVKVDGRETVRIRRPQWRADDADGDRFNRLIRQLHQAGLYDMDRRGLIAMVTAHETSPPDPTRIVLQAVRAARSELEDGLERARAAYSSQTEAQ